MWVTWTMD